MPTDLLAPQSLARAPVDLLAKPLGRDKQILDIFEPDEASKTNAPRDLFSGQPPKDLLAGVPKPKNIIENIGAGEAGQSLKSAGGNIANFVTMKKLPTPVLDAVKAKKAAGQPVSVRDYVGVFNEGFQNSPGGQAMGAVFGSLGAPLAPMVNAVVRGGEKLGIPKEYIDLGMELAPALGLKGKAAADTATAALDKAAQPVRKVFSPATVSPGAARTAMVKRAAVGEATRDTKASIEVMAPFEKRFDTLTDEEKQQFPQFMENYSFLSGEDKIASAAKRDEEGNISTGAKHADIYFRGSIKGDGEEGFITTSGRFVDRKQAARIAEAQKQLVQPEKEPGGLHSEDIGRPAPPKFTLAPELQEAAKTLREGYKLREEKLKNTKSLKDTGLIRDYLNRNAVWPDAKGAETFNRIMFGKQGKGGNVRARKYPTFGEFSAAVKESGGKLQDENFMRSAALYFANMDNYIAHNRAFDTLKDDRLIKYANKFGRTPEGWVPLEGRLAEKIVRPKGGGVIRMQAYAPADVARVYNNFISKDLSGDVGNALRKTRRVLNTITSFKLGLTNMWHAGVVFSGAVSRDLVKATRQLLTPGGRLEGARSLAKAPFAAYRLEKVGEKAHRQYLRLTSDPQAEKLIALATKTNIIQTKRPSYMNMAGPARFENMFDPLRMVGLDAQTKQFGARVGRMMQKLSSPMFDKWIPDVKTGAIVERLRLWLDQHPDSTPKEQEAYAVQLGNSVDNSFGEMMQSNLFWHRALLNVLQVGFISMGWVAGAGRMVKGAAEEAYATARHGAELGPNAEYLMANLVVAGVISTVYQYLHTGQPPQDAKDLLWPKTGGVQHVGGATVPERASLPSGHWNQFSEYLHDPLQELYNEGNIGAKVFWEALHNRDWKNQPIAKPWALWSDDWLKEIGDAAWRYGIFLSNGAVTPIAISNYMRRQQGTGISPQETVFMAARPAPAVISAPQVGANFERKDALREWKSKTRSDRRMQNRLESNQPAPPVSPQ